MLALERSGLLGSRIPSSLRGERMISGGHGGGETPVPIPNTAVKPASADGTWGEAPWESRTPPGFLYDKDLSHCDGSLSRSRQMECSVRHVHSLGDDRPQTLWFSSSQSPNRTASEAADLGSLGESRKTIPTSDGSDVASRCAEEHPTTDHRPSRGRETSRSSRGAHNS